MDTPVYDLILGSKYVPLGVVNKPYFSLPVGRSTKQKRGSIQQVGSPGRNANTPSSTHQRSSNPSALALTLLGSQDLVVYPRSKPRCKPNYRTRGDVLRQNSTFFIRPLFPDIDRVRRNRGKLTTYSREEAPHSGDGRKPQQAHVPWASRLSPSPASQSAQGRKYYSPNLLSQSNPKCFTQVTKYSGTGSRPRKDLDRPSSWHGYTFIFLDFFSYAVITTDPKVRVTSVRSHFMDFLR
ncbi:hypothetical protein Bpfe_004550 [Biomphalaria pfeifferi]|uniref:Uncharacterized protein n=1 Tax=Biomphalaria pfeifferi TaxID=112525 RepID=A0AAD8C501_BIOPF|nr:hypothetical protein Bpfe_004550 [Biomphalaria pfeifferi]